MEGTLTDLAATEALGQGLGDILRPGDLVLFEGDLGAGKTTLIRFVLRAFGVPEDVPVTSPTFALMHEHEGRSLVVHADLYRLAEPGELVELGLEEHIAGHEAVVLVEWGARFERELGPACLLVRLTLRPEGDRHVSIEPRGARGERIVASLAGRHPL
jgi:tRNA threonylcarbamoyladenosine biosynthesis protein TsaE